MFIVFSQLSTYNSIRLRVYCFFSRSCCWTNSKYRPFFSSNSWWFPLSWTLPSLMTYTTSACCMLESRWATAIVVLPFDASFKTSWTTFSLSASRAEVASSKSKILGFLIKARAIAFEVDGWDGEREGSFSFFYRFAVFGLRSVGLLCFLLLCHILVVVMW